jgi:hypothetical protein
MRPEIDYSPETDEMKVFEVAEMYEWNAGLLFENKIQEGFTEPSLVYAGERKVQLIKGDELIIVFNKQHPNRKVVYYSNMPSFGSTEETLAKIPEGVLKEI